MLAKNICLSLCHPTSSYACGNFLFSINYNVVLWNFWTFKSLYWITHMSVKMLYSLYHNFTLILCQMKDIKFKISSFIFFDEMKTIHIINSNGINENFYTFYVLNKIQYRKHGTIWCSENCMASCQNSLFQKRLFLP